MYSRQPISKKQNYLKTNLLKQIKKISLAIPSDDNFLLFNECKVTKKDYSNQIICYFLHLYD